MNDLISSLSSFAETWLSYTGAILWQLALVVGVVWIVARLTARRSAAFRYALWMLVLLRLVLPPGLSSPIGVVSLGSSHSRQSGAADHLEPPSRQEKPNPSYSDKPGRPSRAAGETKIDVPTVAVSLDHGPETVALRKDYDPAGVLFLVWATGVALLGLLILRRYRDLHRQVRSAKPFHSGELHELFLRCCKRIPVPRVLSCTLYSSDTINAPAVTGILRPRIIFPESLIGSSTPAELEPLILHELAHIRRWDVLVNWLQVILQVFHWYNPLVWLANREIRHEREQACDDQVLLACDLGRKEYGASLIKVLQTAPQSKSLSLGLLGVIESRNSMKVRLRRIMDTKRRISSRLTVFSLLVVALIGYLLIPGKAASSNTMISLPENSAASKETHDGPTNDGGEDSADTVSALREEVQSLRELEQEIERVRAKAEEKIKAIESGQSEATPEDTSGNANYALLFDGIDDLVVIPEIATIRADETSLFTVEFWVFLPSYPAAWCKILSKWGGGLDEDDEFLVSMLTDGTFGFGHATSTAPDAPTLGLRSDTQTPTNVWSHICSVWDGSKKTFSIYVNGELTGYSTEAGSTMSMTGEPIRIGTDGHFNQWFPGKIDEVRLWTVARSQEEIKRDMHQALKGDEPGLVGYWDFNEGEGQVVHDRSAKGNKGSLGRQPSQDRSDPKWVDSGVRLRRYTIGPYIAE